MHIVTALTRGLWNTEKLKVPKSEHTHKIEPDLEKCELLSK